MNESTEFVELVIRCRGACLWFMRPEIMPAERAAQLHVLEMIERYGNREDFIAAKRLKQWLSQHSSEAFAVS